MALPDLIEIVPLTKPVRAEITVPGSKSITNRALILAALADGEVTLKGALWSEDTQIMVACLKQLGFLVNVAPDPDEPCNRTIMVIGEGGLVPAGGTETLPLDLFVGNAGTAARFLAPLLCLGRGVYRLHGVARMHERPQASLFQALRELGYRVESDFDNDKLPARIFGGRVAFHSDPNSRIKDGDAVERVLTSRSCKVSIEESSQFASALLLSAGIGGWQVEIVGENAEESPYVAMTSKLMEAFPKNGGTFQIEPDASSGSYFWAADWIFWITRLHSKLGQVGVQHWPKTTWQIDTSYPKLRNLLELNGVLSRKTHLGDSIMTAIVKAPLNQAPHHSPFSGGEDTIIVARASKPMRFTDLGRLRLQETERVVALRTELTKCGAKVVEEDDTLTVWPSALHGATIETYNDHRMAMCFAILGLKVPGIKITNPACVKKTFPNFFQKLAAQPPHGLGAEIWEIKNGQRTRKLAGEELFAD
ncbi:MAG TPA: 3-phosphoshikimate 1-carboxyvinyltransferase [Verrucomicrobiae bacterium]|nr:3-phosphoshikimate 1-carboxyvinyltransferase [Verrucomicrobiae bacterium]